MGKGRVCCGGGGVRWGRGGCVVEGEGLDGEGEGVLWRGGVRWGRGGCVVEGRS